RTNSRSIGAGLAVKTDEPLARTEGPRPSLSAICTTRYPYLPEWRSPASLITLDEGSAQNRSTSSSRMPKTEATSKSGTEQEKEFLLNAPEVSLFIACLGLVNELRGSEAA